MQLTALGRAMPTPWLYKPQMVKVMKISAILLFVACLHVSARGFSQSVTISVKNEKLIRVLDAIERQTAYNFIYDKMLLEKSSKVTIDVVNQPVEKVLQEIFK